MACYDPATVSAAVALARVGTGPSMIARIFSVALNTVHQWLHRRPERAERVPATELGWMLCAVCPEPLAGHPMDGPCSPPRRPQQPILPSEGSKTLVW